MKRDIKELIYLDKNTEELVLPPSSQSNDLKSGQTTRTKKKRRRNCNKHFDTTDNGTEQNLLPEDEKICSNLTSLSPSKQKNSSARKSNEKTSLPKIRTSA